MRHFTMLCAILVLFAVSSASIVSAEMPSDMPAKTSDPSAAAGMDQEMMEKFKEYSTPNENHRVLDQLVGNWEYTMKWWGDPSGAPETSTGTAENQWILDGHFIEQTVSGTSMGQPFNGRNLTGYDNAKKKYQSLWYDNMGTGIIVTSGDYDPSTKSLTVSGEFLCPMYGAMDVRWVTKFVDDNTYIFESYATKDGQEFRSMEITYKRK